MLTVLAKANGVEPEIKPTQAVIQHATSATSDGLPLRIFNAKTEGFRIYQHLVAVIRCGRFNGLSVCGRI